MTRNQTRQIHIGPVAIGGGAPVSVQTMGNVPTADIPAVLGQISRAAELGCDLFRVAVPDMQAAEALKTLCTKSPLPLIADIHFDYRLALAAIEAGIAALRINPGNIGGKERVQAVVNAARPRKIPIRIGVNGGSLEKSLLEKYGTATPEALVESACQHIKILEE
ncbi:MAG: flavodoxin-dependent (E)-4-hydroxy-3-methylbut-2-enyl-diphosphate synthase, partial [Kiritimatiellae bacterium]|nr:flavodoxin-dependent (E)-4-hydroxy-3-methylbut-2-enyl-diphosphate synthase [Kiritimatiellia bacterium]